MDNGAKRRLKKSCAAFANSEGGFLIFGVSDDREASPEARLVGVDPTLDFFEHFGSFPAACVPSVTWVPRSAPISLRTDRVLHVIHIPKSWRGPHWVRQDPGGPVTFAKRTNSGVEAMSYDEVRVSFTQTQEQISRLNMLRIELELIRDSAKEIEGRGDDANLFWSETLGLAVLESAMAGTFHILCQVPLLIKRLNETRARVRRMNHMLELVRVVLSGQASGTHDVAGGLTGAASSANMAAKDALRELQKVFDSLGM